MKVIVLTKSTMPIVKYVAELLGILMNGIFYVISKMGVPNVALAIVIFTIILLMAMMPLQIKQQRFSKLSNLMQPELQKIQAKYKGKTDQVSQQKMLEETNAVYQKYGVSQAGSCIQLLIQMPVLFALYQVIYKIPGYITIIGNKIGVIAADSDFVTMFKGFVEETNSAALTRNFGAGETKNIIDAVYGLSSTQWTALAEKAQGAAFQSSLESIRTYVQRATNFFGMSISDTPMEIIRLSWANKAYLLVIGAALFPILAWFTQWLTFKLMPQPPKPEGNDSGSALANSMQSMNTVMPVMSAFFCLTLPVGVGIYWIMSAVIRAAQQFFVNKKLDSETPEEIIEKAQEKMNKKRAKQGLPPQKINTNAHLSTRSLEAENKMEKEREAANAEMARKQRQASTEYYNHQSAKPGSLAAKANMVKAFDEKNKKSSNDYKK
ncbi:MAG: YidC/Oxa1 family membrane protein insertase [Lachnospiraceae bacterium]|nr:YidC/Oxa1 family membrane protein insertase [Lachnospiraceae bacterium]